MSEEERAALIIEWARRLQITKGYGWSKALAKAADYAKGATNEVAVRTTTTTRST